MCCVTVCDGYDCAGLTDELSQGLSQLAITGDDHSTQDSELGGEDQTGSQSQTASTGHLSGDGHEVRARNVRTTRENTRNLTSFFYVWTITK